MSDQSKSYLEKLLNLHKGDLKTGGYTTIVPITGAAVGADGAAYIAGDVVGDKAPIKIPLYRSGAKTGVIQAITIHDTAGQAVDLDVIIFTSNPTATTFTDNAAVAIADADLPNCFVVSFTGTDFINVGSGNTVCTMANLGLPYATTEACLYFAIVSRGAPTFVADSLSIKFHIFED